jgi:hypothetical protein
MADQPLVADFNIRSDLDICGLDRPKVADLFVDKRSSSFGFLQKTFYFPIVKLA